MSVFRFPLEPLLDYRKHRRDLCRQQLAQTYAEEQSLQVQQQRLEQQRTQLIAELRELGAHGEVDIERAASRRYYAGRLLGDIAAMVRQRQAVRERMELCRRDVIKADQDVKVLEKLKQKQQTVFRDDAERREGRELEDTWSAARAGERT